MTDGFVTGMCPWCLRNKPDVLIGNPDIIHLGCMAHARRPFAELAKLAKTTGKSHQAMAYFQKLYAIEKRVVRQNCWSYISAKLKSIDK